MAKRRWPAGYLACGTLMAALALSHPAAGQAPRPTKDPNVSPASVNRTTPRPTAQVVRFAGRAPQVGDQVEQTSAREMRLTTTQRQGDKVIESSSRTMRSEQQRRVTTTRVDNGRTQAVLVKYGDVTKRTEHGPAPAAVGTSKSDTQQPAAESTTANEPVAGKTYRCWRDGEKLNVTDESGNAPPPAEAEIVAADMDSVGRPNPLADFLASQTVPVGQTLALPPELAQRLLSLDDRFGKVMQFQLKLREVRDENGVACAVFQVTIEAASQSASQMRLLVDGPLVVEIDTCRTVRSNLSGPLAMSESRGSYSTAYQLISIGKLSTSISSSYRDAQN